MKKVELRRTDGEGAAFNLDDSWFDRPEIRAVAAELRQRLARAYREDGRAPNGAPLRGAAQPGLDDSWFK